MPQNGRRRRRTRTPEPYEITRNSLSTRRFMVFGEGLAMGVGCLCFGGRVSIGSQPMAVLEHQTTRERRVVAPYCRVGRAPGNELVIDARYVSNEHASLRWKETGWELCDLASRNGTRVDGRTLAAGERVVVVEGQEIAFGQAEEAWRLVDAGPSGLMAVCQETGVIVRGEEGILALPSVERAEVTVYEGSDEGWWVERSDGTEELLGAGMVVAGGARWHVGLPAARMETTAHVEKKELTLAEVWLRFRVSRGEGHIELAILTGDGDGHVVRDFGPRTCHEVLLELARRRMRDAAERRDRRTTEHGLVKKAELLDWLGMEEQQLNLHVYKLRVAFKEAGIVDGQGIVEQRKSGERRVGVERVVMEEI